MDNRQLFVILLICCTFFLAYLIHPSIWGSDSFYFLSISCGKTFGYVETPVLSQLFFQGFPCNEFLAKAFSFALLLGATFLLATIGNLVSKKYGWLAALLVFTNSYWFTIWTSFEDDALGMYFLLISLYFFVKAKKTGGAWLNTLSLFFCLLAGLFWKGAFLWLAGFALSSFPALIALIIIFFFVVNMDFGAITNTVFPNLAVSENQVGAGLFFQSGLWLGIFNLYNFLFLQTGFWIVIAFVNEKFAPILSIYLALALVSWLEKPMFFIKLRDELVSLVSQGKMIFAFMLITMLVISAQKLVDAYPNQNQIDATKFSIEQANGKTVYNDWSYGYWVLYFGGNPIKAGGAPEGNDKNVSGVYLTERELPVCRLLKEFGKGFNGTAKVYSC